VALNKVLAPATLGSANLCPLDF